MTQRRGEKRSESPDFRPLGRKLTLVEDTRGVESLVDLARQLPLTSVGIDFEYRSSRPAVFIKKVKGQDRYWQDPRSVVRP